MTSTAGRMNTAPATRSSLPPSGRPLATTPRNARGDVRLLMVMGSFSSLHGIGGGTRCVVRVSSPPLSLLRDAQAGFVGVQLRLAADLVGLRVPLVGDLRHALVDRNLARQVLSQRG